MGGISPGLSSGDPSLLSMSCLMSQLLLVSLFVADVMVVSDLGRINPGRSYGESRQTTETHLWNGRELMGTLCQIQLVKIATWLLFY